MGKWATIAICLLCIIIIIIIIIIIFITITVIFIVNVIVVVSIIIIIIIINKVYDKLKWNKSEIPAAWMPTIKLHVHKKRMVRHHLGWRLQLFKLLTASLLQAIRSTDCRASFIPRPTLFLNTPTRSATGMRSTLLIHILTGTHIGSRKLST